MAAMTYESIVAAVQQKAQQGRCFVHSRHFGIPGRCGRQSRGYLLHRDQGRPAHVEPYDYHDRNARLILNGTT